MSDVIGSPALARLAFWAKNMTAIRGAGMEWPGFGYTDGEWRRFGVLAAAIDDASMNKYIAVNAVVFIALAAIGMVAIFLPVASALFPEPAKTPPLEFVLVLAGTALLILGAGLPLSLAVAARLCATPAIRQRLSGEPGDAALLHKVGFQITRVSAIMCGVFVPGTMLWIAFNVEAGPMVTVLKLAAIGAMAASIAYSRYGAPKEKAPPA